MSIRSKSSSNKGFTVIELLVVIAIVGIMTTVGLIMVSGLKQKAIVTKKKSDVAQIAKAVQAYYIGEKKKPEKIEAWCRIGTAGCLTELVTSGYIKFLPLSPDPPAHYYYYNPNNKDNFATIITTLTPLENGPGVLWPANCVHKPGDEDGHFNYCVDIQF